jgi:signal transduction histidine kinase
MIIEQHGGILSVASDMHDGARFEVTLPTNLPAALGEENSRVK